MNKNTNIIGFIGTLILFLLVVLGVEKKYINTNFKKEIHPSKKLDTQFQHLKVLLIVIQEYKFSRK